MTTTAKTSAIRQAVSGMALSAALLAGASCANFAREADHGVTAIQFSDVPVPDGMQLKTYSHESHSFEIDGGFRYGDFEYLGALQPDVVSQYMVDRMSVHGWTLAGDRVVEGGRELAFWRRPYRTTCRVYKQDYRTRMKVEVRTLAGDGRLVVDGQLAGDEGLAGDDGAMGQADEMRDAAVEAAGSTAGR